MAAAAERSGNVQEAGEALRPPVLPEDTGVEREVLQKLLAKTLHVHGTMTTSALAREMKLPATVINALLKELQKLLIVEAKGMAGSDMRAEIRFALGGRGHEFALDAMAQSQYVGPAPVSLESFIAQIGRQSIRRDRLSRQQIVDSLSHLVLPPYLVDLLGPAFNSARSILLYGEPGNGKTSIAEAVGRAFTGTIHVPYCFTVGGQIVNFFDPTIHTAIEVEQPGTSPSRSAVDPRWQLCRRPFVITGGELTLDMLDLSFNPVTHFYEAPVHFKAAGGVFVVDDFGRQRTDPQSVLNRWIVPLERGFDQLTLNTGKKFSVPFDQLVIFSTNIEPSVLADAGGLRRLYYKIQIPSPTAGDYKKIFFDLAERRGVEIEMDLFESFYDSHYRQTEVAPAGHHPKYLIDFVESVCQFRGSAPAADSDLLEAGWRNLHGSAAP
ncbi:MAG: AAA family ATPase [Mesorhizobium sp.]